MFTGSGGLCLPWRGSTTSSLVLQEGPLPPSNGVLVQFPVFPVITGGNEADDCRVTTESCWKSEVYMEKRNGARMVHCVAPLLQDTKSDSHSQIRKYCGRGSPGPTERDGGPPQSAPAVP